MNLVGIFATALLLGLPSATASLRQDAAPPAKSTGQAPASAPAENAQTSATPQPPASQAEVSGSQQKQKTTAPSAARAGKRRAVRKGGAAPATQPHRIVIHEGGVPEPSAQLAPGMSPEQASRQRQNAEQLLASTEVNLKQLAGRSLKSGEQETLGQIHNYMEGARSALQDGDTQRARTLALKAHLLSDDLVKHSH
jgi:hypothetical protein